VIALGFLQTRLLDSGNCVDTGISIRYPPRLLGDRDEALSTGFSPALVRGIYAGFLIAGDGVAASWRVCGSLWW
jgi:hypothetical protein